MIANTNQVISKAWIQSTLNYIKRNSKLKTPIKMIKIVRAYMYALLDANLSEDPLAIWL